MSTTSLRHVAAKALLVGGLLVGNVTLWIIPTGAQTPDAAKITLSPSAQQTLASLLGSVPADERVLVLNAVQSLGRDRAEAKLSELAQYDPKSPGAVSWIGQAVIVPGLQLLPPQCHQAFVDGLLGVTQIEEKFAIGVLTELRAKRERFRIVRPEPLRRPSEYRNWPEMPD